MFVLIAVFVDLLVGEKKQSSDPHGMDSKSRDSRAVYVSYVVQWLSE